MLVSPLHPDQTGIRTATERLLNLRNLERKGAHRLPPQRPKHARLSGAVFIQALQYVYEVVVCESEDEFPIGKKNNGCDLTADDTNQKNATKTRSSRR